MNSDLTRKILEAMAAVATVEAPLVIEGYSDEAVGRQVYLMNEAGLLVAHVSRAGPHPTGRPRWLTVKGRRALARTSM